MLEHRHAMCNNHIMNGGVSIPSNICPLCYKQFIYNSYSYFFFLKFKCKIFVFPSHSERASQVFFVHEKFNILKEIVLIFIVSKEKMLLINFWYLFNNSPPHLSPFLSLLDSFVYHEFLFLFH